MNIVIDTNIVASAIFFGGKPLELIRLLLAHKINVFATVEIIEEYKDTLIELEQKYPLRHHACQITQIVNAINIIKSSSMINVCRDPDDNKFLSCAIDSRCIYIVSGDNDLLSLKQYQNVDIITVAEFLEYYKRNN